LTAASTALEAYPLQMTEAFASAVGLRKAIGPRMVTVGGRDLLRHMLRDFESAVEHATQEARGKQQDTQQAAEPSAADGANPAGS
jgi:hypothetical protein